MRFPAAIVIAASLACGRHDGGRPDADHRHLPVVYDSTTNPATTPPPPPEPAVTKRRQIGYTSETVKSLPTCRKEECGPAPGYPNWGCPDGVSVGGRGPCARLPDGHCGWIRLECPDSSLAEPPL